MKYVIDVPDYDPSEGLRLEWEINFRISTRMDDTGAIIIVANSPGLVSLARHLLALAQLSMPAGHHLHLDTSNSLEEGSRDLIIERE
jgi:hypothetical protein